MVSLSHSTTTVPLNFAGFVGYRTSSRVVYGTLLCATDTFHTPFEPQNPLCW